AAFARGYRSGRDPGAPRARLPGLRRSRLMRLWRLAREPHCRDREGTGAYLSGGRWTPPGTRVLHAAGSIALAALEYLVHSSRPPADLALVAIDVPEALIERPAIDDLPEGWASPFPSEKTQA